MRAGAWTLIYSRTSMGHVDLARSYLVHQIQGQIRVEAVLLPLRSILCLLHSDLVDM
jgi:hypothetical protein